MLDQEAAASLEDAPIWLKFGPDLERAIPLDEPQRRIELKVRLEVLRESQLDFHCIGASVVQYDFFSVELLVDKHIEIVLLFLNVDGYIDTSALHRDRNRFGEVLILQEERELLRHFSELHRNKGELDLGAAVTVDFCRALETDLGEELLEDVGLGRLVVIIDGLVGRHDQGRLSHTFSQACGGSKRAPAVHALRWQSLHIARGRLHRHGVLNALILLHTFACSIALSRSLSIASTLASALLALLVLSNRLIGCRRRIAHFLPPALLLLLDVVDGDERDRRAIRRLHIDLSRQGALIRDSQVLSVLLSEDYIAEVNCRVFNLYERFLAGTDERNVDAAGFTENGKDGIDVLIQLRSERYRDSGRQASRHPARRRVLDMEEVLDLILQRQKFE